MNERELDARLAPNDFGEGGGAHSEFIEIASHELRTPLTAILVPLQMIDDGSIDASSATGRSLIHLARKAAERMTRLVDSVRLYERLVRGRVVQRLEPCDMYRLTEVAIANARRSAYQSGPVDFTLFGDSAPLFADPDHVVVMLEQILTNAMMAMPKGGVVLVEVRTDGETAWVEVHDEGPGVPEALHETIYEPFFQADTSRTRPIQGLGLGLAVCRKLATRSGGRVWHESPATGGAIFCLQLPCVALEDEPTERSSPPSA